MGLGQTLLTIMALMLMGRIILNMNSTTLDAGTTKDIAEYRITGTSLGLSIIEKATGLAFDSKTDDGGYAMDSTKLSAVLGPEAASSEDTIHDNVYDDFDDYNKFYQCDSTVQSARYVIRAKVEYVQITSNNVVVTSAQTFNKRITVWVTSPSLVDYWHLDSLQKPKPDTLKFQAVYSYWFFR
jgi:hypothetical protein